MKALVTGCSQGIGGATCIALADEQARSGGSLRLTVTDLQPNPGTEAVIAELEARGAAVSSVYGDMRVDADIRAIVDAATQAMGGLDCVVANAGVTAPATVVDTTDEQFDALFDINVKAVWRLAKYAYPHLVAGRGSFVAVGSMSGLEPHPTNGLYGPSKAAVIHLCRALGIEWAPDGIRVNVVCPGMVRTPLTESTYRNEEVARARDAIVPLGRVATPRDIAEVIAFLCSERAAYLTGQAILVDGALTHSMLGRLPTLPGGPPASAI